MKKSRIIALALVIAVMLMGAGYAAWTDTLNINTSATTGKFNVEFIKGEVFGMKYAPYAGTAQAEYTKYSTPEGTATGMLLKTIKQSPYACAAASIDPTNSNIMNVCIQKLFPGSLGLFTARVKNTGSIPAKFDKVRVEFDAANSVKLDDLKQRLMCAGGLIKIDGNGNRINLLGRGYWNYKLADLETALNGLLKDIQLDVGDTLAFDVPDDCKQQVAAAVDSYDPDSDNCLIFYLPSNSPNDEKIQNAKASFKIHIDWKQFNQ